MASSVIAQNQQTIIHTSADYGLRCDGNADDTQRFMNAIGTGQGSQNLYIIFVNGVCNIKWVNPITVPSYVTFDFTQQGSLFLAAGSTLNINAAIFETDYHPIFTGPGTYNISPRNPVTCLPITGGIACQQTGAGGLPANPTTSIQFNNSGTFGAINNVAAGSSLVSNGATSTPIFQKKVQHDVRDAGVDCTGVSDSTTAFQNLINAAPDYSTIVLPENCIIKVSGTPAITINQRNGLQFVGQGRGANFCGTTQSVISYAQAYASGNTIININQSQQLLFQNLTLLANGNADIGWNVDQSTSPPITTANVWQDVCVRNTAAKNAAFKGWQFSAVSISNVEAQHLIRPFVQCSNNGPLSGSDSGFGIWFSASANQKDEIIEDPGFGGCSVAVNFGNGGALSWTGGLDSASWINLQMGGFNDALWGFRSENARGAVVQETNAVGPHLIEHTDFAAVIGVPIDCSTGGSGCGNTTLINNEADSVPANWFNAHGATNSFLFATNNRNFSYDPYNWQEAITYPGGNTHGSPLGGLTVSAGIAVTPNAADCGAGSCASPAIVLDGEISSGSVLDRYFVQAAPNEVSNATSNSTLILAHDPASSGTITPWVAIGGTQTGAAYAQVSTPTNLGVTTRGVAGGTTYTYEVVAHGSTGTTPPSATTTIATGNATLNTSNFNFLQFPPAPGCIYFDIYRTACGGVGICNTNPTGKIGVRSCAAIPNVTTGQEPNFSDTGLAGDASSPSGSNTTGQIQSTVPTGLAPLSITSTTPVANLSTVPTTYNHSGTQQTGVHIVEDSCTLGTSCAVTLTGSAIFTSSSSYQCTATDQTAANAVKFAPSSGSAFALTGTGTDVLGYICIGN